MNVRYCYSLKNLISTDHNLLWFDTIDRMDNYFVRVENQACDLERNAVGGYDSAVYLIFTKKWNSLPFLG